MSIQKYLKTTKSDTVKAINFSEFEFYQDNINEAIVEINDGLNALSIITSLEASISKVMEIKDNATARIALAVVLSSSDYDSIRPSFEGSEESDTKEESKGVLKKLYETTKSVILAIFKALKTLVSDIFDRSKALQKTVNSFNDKLKNLRGKPKKDNLNASGDLSQLFDGGKFSKERFDIKVHEYVSAVVNKATKIINIDEKNELTTDTVIYDAVMDLKSSSGDQPIFMPSDEKLSPVTALEVDEIRKMTAHLLSEFANASDTKTLIDKKVKIYEGAISSVKLTGTTEMGKATIKRLQHQSTAVAGVVKKLVNQAYLFDVARFSLLVAHAKNIESVNL
jgi:hypothetical protein